jgi:hypothetical protein
MLGAPLLGGTVVGEAPWVAEALWVEEAPWVEEALWTGRSSASQ